MFPSLAQRIVLLLTSYHGLTTSVGSAAVVDDKSRIKYRIAEEQPRGAFVANLSADCGDVIANLPPEARSLIRFRFLSDFQPLFDIDSVSSVIRTVDVIDRDATSLCRQKDVCEVNLDVVLQPVQFFQVIKVTVEITDVNDNSPKFPDPVVTLSVSESAIVGSTYIVPAAMDPDSPLFGVQRYELDSKSSLFGLDVISKIDGTQEVKLVLRDKLNRELVSEHRMRLFAIDGGFEVPKTGSTTLIINVVDVNDNRPKFSSNAYDVTVIENTPPGTVVLQVTATDGDSGNNGLVDYGFTSSTMESPGGRLFSIDSTSGSIAVKGVVDYESATVYQLVVVARDRGHDPLSSEAVVIIRIEDMNDNAPTITIRTLDGQAAIAEVIENAPVGTFVGQVTVVDEDFGLNGRVNCTLICVPGPASTFNLVQSYATEYRLLTGAVLDRERTEQFTVTVRCQDGGGIMGSMRGGSAAGSRVSRVSEKSIRVLVGDVNDNTPVFSQQTYKGTVIEQNYIGVSVLQVTASDWDTGENARIHYSIPGNVASLFHIDQRGVISAHVTIDRERYDSFRFPVLATDGGSPVSRTGSALVIVSVEDINDERPRFLQPTYIFSVSENEPSGTTIGAVTAEDKDGPLYNIFAYSFVSGVTTDDLFAIDPGNGMLSTRKPLDREMQGLYQFTVSAYDRKLTSMSSTAMVSVQILDRNDNSPEFRFPNRYNNTIHVSNRVPVGHVIAQVSARDADIDQNARVSYQLTHVVHDATPSQLIQRDHHQQQQQPPHPVDFFNVDAERGFVTVTRRLTTIDFRVFRLNVTARDHGQPSRWQSEILNIYVNRSVPLDQLVTSPQAGSRPPMSAFSLVLVVGLVSGFCVIVILFVAAFAIVKQRKTRRTRQQNGTHVPVPSSDINDVMPVVKATLSNGGNHDTSVNADEYDIKTKKDEYPIEQPSPAISTSHSIYDIKVKTKLTSLEDVTYHQQQQTLQQQQQQDDVNLQGGPSLNDVRRGPQPGCLTPADNGKPRRANSRNGNCGGSARTVPPPPPPPRACYRLLQSQRRRLSTGGGGNAMATPSEPTADRTPLRKQSLGSVTNSVDRAIWSAACKLQRKELQPEAQEKQQQQERNNRQTGLYDYQLLLPQKLNEQHHQQQQNHHTDT